MKIANKIENAKEVLMLNGNQTIKIYKDHLRDFSEAQLRHISAEGTWSIGQMYLHLIEVAFEYLDNIEACAAANEEQKLGKTEAGENLYRRGGFPAIKIKLSDDPGNTPSNSKRKEELMQGLIQVEEKMEEWEGKADAINPNFKVKHGGFGWLNAREWFDLVDMHFRHHLRQKKELEEKLEN
ncbi:DinB family protein [Metabacillus idriensis]|uniref:DinB family protein n=1 Tax=Metabacillus idriensis TaxID=324768 RepID=UPI003D2DCD7A